MYTNANNIIETGSTLYMDVARIDKYSTGKRTYEYNANGCPVKLIMDDGTTEEYVY